MTIQNGYGFVHYPLTNEGIEAALRAVETLHQVTINNISYDCSVSNQLRQVLQNTGRHLNRQLRTSSGATLSSIPTPRYGNFPTGLPFRNGNESPPSISSWWDPQGLPKGQYSSYEADNPMPKSITVSSDNRMPVIPKSRFPAHSSCPPAALIAPRLPSTDDISTYANQTGLSYGARNQSFLPIDNHQLPQSPQNWISNGLSVSQLHDFSVGASVTDSRLSHLMINRDSNDNLSSWATTTTETSTTSERDSKGNSPSGSYFALDLLSGNLGNNNSADINMMPTSLGNSQFFNNSSDEFIKFF